MIKKIIVFVLFISLFSCGQNQSGQSVSCIDSSLINQKVQKCIDYQLDTLTVNNRSLLLSFRLLKLNFFELQAEREFMFYTLSDLKLCMNNELDSIKVLFAGDSISEKKLFFSFTLSELKTSLIKRDSLYMEAVTKMIQSKNYRLLVTAFAQELGVVINGNSNGMYDTDFFYFL